MVMSAFGAFVNTILLPDDALGQHFEVWIDAAGRNNKQVAALIEATSVAGTPVHVV